MIPVSRPFLGAEEEAAVVAALRSGWVTQGPRVAEFERAFAAALGQLEAIAVSSCTTNRCGVLIAILQLGPASRTFLISSRPFFGMMTPADSLGPLAMVRSTLDSR